MIVGGGIIAVLGLISIIYGIQQNNNIVAQISSLVFSGRTNPGTIWIVLGSIAIVVGLLILYREWKKKNPNG